MEEGTGPGNWPRSTFDLTRASQDAGHEPEYSIEAALTAYADWLRVGNPF
jgi:nucleoside-diphosphate-sugar epimerase